MRKLHKKNRSKRVRNQFRRGCTKNANMVAKGPNARTVEGLPYANMVAKDTDARTVEGLPYANMVA